MAANSLPVIPSTLPIRPAPFSKFSNPTTSTADTTAINNITQWLQLAENPIADANSDQRSINGKQLTNHWLCEIDEYHVWHDSKSRSVLWVLGSSEMGEPGISSSLIDHIQRTEKAPVLGFSYRDAKTDSKDHGLALVKRWITQLLPHCYLLEFMLRPLTRVPLETVSNNILWEIFLEALSSLERVYFIIDSLHEVSTLLLYHLAGRLRRLATFQPRKVKLLLFGQLKDQLKDVLEAIAPFIVRIDLKSGILDTAERRATTTTENTYTILRSLLYGNDSDESKGNLNGQATSAFQHISLPAKLSLGSARPGSSMIRLNGIELARTQLVRYLIERGIGTANTQRSLLHHLFGYVNCSVSCLEIFFEYVDNPDIDFNRRDPSGMTVFHAACAMIIMDSTYMLPGNSHLAPTEAWNRATGLFLRMISHGANICATDKRGRNALHLLLGNREMCEGHILTFLGRPLAKTLATAKNDSGATPFQNSLRNLRPRSCDILLSLGADLLERDVDGSTALHHIASQWLYLQPEHRSGTIVEKKVTSDAYLLGVLALWRRFISLGGSINARDTRGNPPLFAFLASSGPRLSSMSRQETDESTCYHVEYFDIFFDAYDADLTVRNNTGQTALHIVAERVGQEEIDERPGYDAALFSFLVDRGLDPLAKDVDGKTGVDVARKLGKSEIIRLVEDRPEDVPLVE